MDPASPLTSRKYFDRQSIARRTVVYKIIDSLLEIIFHVNIIRVITKQFKFTSKRKQPQPYLFTSCLTFSFLMM